MSEPRNQNENESTARSFSSDSESLVVESDAIGERLDHFLSRRYPHLSRSALSKLIAQSSILVDDLPVKAGYSLRSGNRICISFPQTEISEILPEPMDLFVLFEDEDILVINKPPGLVVHPGCGTNEATLAHGLLFHYRQLPMTTAGRPGIVHRLDKDTSGVMLVAKTEVALRNLMAAFKNRKVHKVYLALLPRCPKESEGRIVAPIGRHPVNRQKMAIVPKGRYAATSWRITERFANNWALAQICIETGRTHQIRVHMASIHCPVAGDTLYGGVLRQDFQPAPKRQMLHASQLDFPHPANDKTMRMRAPLWPDMQEVVNALRGST